MLEINKIYNEDCLLENGMQLIDNKSIDMILCDLPYGITVCNWDVQLDLNKLWQEYKRIIKDNGIIVLTGSQPFTTDLINSNREWFKYEIIWEKERPTNIFNLKKQFGKVHENILMFYKKQPTYNPQKEDSWRVLSRPNSVNKVFKSMQNIKEIEHLKVKPKYSKTYDPKTRFPRSVIKVSRSTRTPGKTAHPTQKPLALFEYLIKTFTNENDLVLDNCIGSGTTALACINTKRNFIGFEKNKEYFDLANVRIK